MLKMISKYILPYYLISFLLNGLANSQSFLEDSQIFKCQCPWNQVQVSDGSCVPSNSTYVVLWDNENQSQVNVHLKEAPNVSIKPLSCPENYSKTKMDKIAFLSPTGGLLSYPEPETDKYCMENTLSDDGVPGMWYEMCVFYEPFQFCCNSNEIMSLDGTCTPAQEELIDDITSIHNLHQSVVSNVDCKSARPDYSLVSPSKDITEMKYSFDYYKEGRSKEMCMAPYLNEDDMRIMYLMKSCPCKEADAACIISCCEIGQAFNTSLGKCVPFDAFVEHIPKNIVLPNKTHIAIMDTMDCPNARAKFLDFNETQHRILQDGSLSTNGGSFPLHKYCVGTVLKDGDVLSGGVGCFVDFAENYFCNWRYTIIQVLLSISTVFIAITIIVYLWIKDLRRKTGGVYLISQLAALFISQVNLIVMQLHQNSFSENGCLAAGIIEIIFVLASFFWLNVMCFDVWNTFRVLRPFSQKMLNKKLLVKYSLYAWGLPFLIGMIALAVELKGDTSYVAPSFTLSDGCFFTQKDFAAQWVFLYGFIAIILVVNTIFFAHLMFKVLPEVMKDKQSLTMKLSSREKNTQVSKEKALLYGKLFLVMGIPWIIEVLTSFAPPDHACYIWIFDVFNLLRGLFIFIIFICTKSTLKKIKQTWLGRRFLPQGETDETDGSRQTTMNTTVSMT